MNHVLIKQESPVVNDVVNVGIYARVSTDLDSQKTSNEHQVALLKEHALTLGKREGTNWVVRPEHIYEDQDVSGKKVHILERPAMKILVHDVQSGKIQAVLFKGVTRFGRDMEDGVALYRQLTRLYRIRVLSLEEGFDSTKADASLN